MRVAVVLVFLRELAGSVLLQEELLPVQREQERAEPLQPVAVALPQARVAAGPEPQGVPVPELLWPESQLRRAVLPERAAVLPPGQVPPPVLSQAPAQPGAPMQVPVLQQELAGPVIQLGEQLPVLPEQEPVRALGPVPQVAESRESAAGLPVEQRAALLAAQRAFSLFPCPFWAALSPCPRILQQQVLQLPPGRFLSLLPKDAAAWPPSAPTR